MNINSDKMILLKLAAKMGGDNLIGNYETLMGLVSETAPQKMSGEPVPRLELKGAGEPMVKRKYKNTKLSGMSAEEKHEYRKKQMREASAARREENAALRQAADEAAKKAARLEKRREKQPYNYPAETLRPHAMEVLAEMIRLYEAHGQNYTLTQAMDNVKTDTKYRYCMGLFLRDNGYVDKTGSGVNSCWHVLKNPDGSEYGSVIKKIEELSATQKALFNPVFQSIRVQK